MKPATRSSPAKEYHSHLLQLRLSCNTRIAYKYQVAQFLRWLQDSSIELNKEPSARDQAIAQYKNYLKNNKGVKTTSINSALTAIKNFCQFMGLGEPHIERERA